MNCLVYPILSVPSGRVRQSGVFRMKYSRRNVEVRLVIVFYLDGKPLLQAETQPAKLLDHS